MKIIKRNGAEVPFDITKIITAVTKASDSVGGQARLSREQITQIAAAVTDQCQQLNRAVSVEEVQDLVENQLMDIQAHDVARHYITYRYVQSLKRQTNTTDERILSLIECQNEEVKQENANKNPTVNSVQRDYMAGEISKDLTARLLLDPEIVKAHQEGLIHFHDSDYFAQHMHNCDLVNLEDMLQNGTVISGTYIEKPHSFSTACNIHDCTSLQQHLFCHNTVHFHIVYHKDMRAGKLRYRHHSTDRKLIVFENLLHITNAIFADDLLRYDCRKC